MSKEITILRPTRLPAARKLANDWRAFTKLMAECDELIEVKEVMQRQLLELRARRPGDAPVIDISEAEVSEETTAQIKRCKQALERFDQPEFYEEDDNEGVLKSELIAERLSLMLGCVDTGPTNTEPEAFARMMVTHVYDADITYPALLSGCRAIEQDKKPVRSTGYVLEVLQEHQAEWSARRSAINWIGNTANMLRDAIVEAQAKLQLEQAEEKVQRVQRAFGAQALLLERHRKSCEEAKRAAIEAHHRYQQHRRSVIDAEHRLGERQAALDAAKAERDAKLPPPEASNNQTQAKEGER